MYKIKILNWLNTTLSISMQLASLRITNRVKLFTTKPHYYFVDIGKPYAFLKLTSFACKHTKYRNASMALLNILAVSRVLPHINNVNLGLRILTLMQLQHVQFKAVWFCSEAQFAGVPPSPSTFRELSYGCGTL